jgi:hypothetical protein
VEVKDARVTTEITEAAMAVVIKVAMAVGTAVPMEAVKAVAVPIRQPYAPPKAESGMQLPEFAYSHRLVGVRVGYYPARGDKKGREFAAFLLSGLNRHAIE